MRKALLSLLVTLSFIFFSYSTSAQKTWDRGANTDNWGDAANWAPDGVPTGTNPVSIGPFTVNVDVPASVNSLTLNLGTVLNVTNNITITSKGSLLINEGATATFNANAQIKGGGNGDNGIQVSIMNGANLATANIAGFNTKIGTVNNQTLTGSIAVNLGARSCLYGPLVNYSYTGTTAQSSGNAVVSAAILESSNSVGLTLTNLTVAVSSKVTGTGSLVLPSNGTLRVAGVVDIATLNATGTGCTVEYNGSDQSVKVTTYRNLILSNTGIKELTGVSAVLESFSVNNIALAVGSSNLNIGGNANVNGVLNLSTNNTIASIGGNLSGSGSLTQGTNLLTIGGNWEHIGAYTGATGSEVRMMGNNASIANRTGTLNIKTLNIQGASVQNNITSGSLVIEEGLKGSNTSRLIQGAGSKLELKTAIVDVALNARALDNTVVYSGTSPQIVAPGVYEHLIYAGGSLKTMTGVTAIGKNFELKDDGTTTTFANSLAGVGGKLTIGNGTTLNIAGEHNIEGDWVNNGTFNAPVDTKITFNGSLVQTISGTKVSTFHNLALLKNGVPLKLQSDISVNGILSFSNGIIDPISTGNPEKVIFNDGAGYTGAKGSNSTDNPYAFVNGPVQKIGNDGFTFPIGKNTKLVSLKISAPASVTDAFTANYFPADARALGNIAPAISNELKRISACEYWSLVRNAGTSNVNVTIGWSDLNACPNIAYITQPKDVVVAYLNEGPNPDVWDDYSSRVSASNTLISDGASSTSGEVTWVNAPAYGFFTLGSLSTANSLPVVFANVRATQKEGGIEVAFSNMTEEDVAAYYVERSADGNTFKAVGTIAARSNNNGRADYSFLDRSPQTGSNYYRIRAVETTGKVVFSPVVRISAVGKVGDLVVFPNPAPARSAMSLQLNNLPAGKYQIRVFSQAGQLVHTAQFSHERGHVSTPLPTRQLQAGRYILELNGAVRLTRSFVVQ